MEQYSSDFAALAGMPGMSGLGSMAGMAGQSGAPGDAWSSAGGADAGAWPQGGDAWANGGGTPSTTAGDYQSHGAYNGHNGGSSGSRSSAPAISASGWLGVGQPISGAGVAKSQPLPAIADEQPPQQEETEEKRNLVEAIKKIQRTSDQSKAQWYTFCHMQGTWNYDPGRHTEDFLQEFLKALDTPALMQGPLQDIGEGDSQQTLAQHVKLVQKSGFKESWYNFCMWFQMSSDPDPLHYDADFLRLFLNCIVAAQVPKPEGDREPTEAKTALVGQIKDIQKNGFRDHWCAFNMMFKWTSDLDPARHQERFLKKFVQAVELAAPVYGVTLGEEGSSAYGFREWSEEDITEQIFVGGLPKSGADREAIVRHFTKFGAVKDVTLKFHETGAFRGFGFVTFESKDAAKAVLENSEGNSFEGKRLNCQPASGKTSGGCGTPGKGFGKKGSKGGCGLNPMASMGSGGGCGDWGFGDWGCGGWGGSDWGGSGWGGDWDMGSWGWSAMDSMAMMAAMGMMLGGGGDKGCKGDKGFKGDKGCKGGKCGKGFKGMMPDKGKGKGKWDGGKGKWESKGKCDGKGKGKPKGKGKDDWFGTFAEPWGGMGDWSKGGADQWGMGGSGGWGKGGADQWGMGGGGGGSRFGPY